MIDTRIGTRFLVPVLQEIVAFRLFVDGVYEPDVTAFLAGQLHPGDIFLDVGANLGVFTLLGAKAVGSRGTVLAVEPSPHIFPYLDQNVRLNRYNNIHLERVAAYDKDDHALPFYEAPAAHGAMGSLSNRFDRSPQQVRASTLDTLCDRRGIDQVDLVKVDVEGYEWLVFRGFARRLEEHHAPLIIFEFCDWAERQAVDTQVGDAQRLLLAYGYRLWRLDDYVNDNPPLQTVITEGADMLVAAKSKR